MSALSRFFSWRLALPDNRWTAVAHQALFNRGMRLRVFSRATALRSSPLKNAVTPFVLSAAIRYGKCLPYTICEIGMSCTMTESVMGLATWAVS